MCSRASGLFCACLFVSCIFHSCRCTTKQGNHSHRDHEHHVESDFNFSRKKDGEFFLHELFIKYGHNGVLTVKEFEHMLDSLGLSSVILNFHNSMCHDCHTAGAHVHETEPSEISQENVNTSGLTHEFNVRKNLLPNETAAVTFFSETVDDNSGTKKDVRKSIDSVLNETVGNTNAHSEISLTDVFENQCENAEKIVQFFNISMQDDITQSDFLWLCPAIIYKIDHNQCMKKHFHNSEEIWHSGNYVWAYATLSVFIISVCGLLSVAMIPLIQKLCYHVLIQFLVGLAVGSLAGDALLHLLPHSLVLFNEHEYMMEKSGVDIHHENSVIYRGLIALFGIYLFFLAERLLSHITSYKRLKQSTKVIQVPKLAGALRRMDGEQSRAVGEKLSHHKHGSYGYKFEQTAVEALETLNEVVLEENSAVSAPDKEGTQSHKDIVHVNAEISEDNASHMCDVTLSRLEVCETQTFEKDKKKGSPAKQPIQVDVTYFPSEKPDDETPTEECHRETVVYRHAHDDHSYVVTVTDHHHHHGHSHEVPGTISAVAWMVVVGDGLHNFCDGLAIGVAFGAGTAGGISTAVAVLCHELPHELGDFAMLLKAGMSVKQAIFYNSISSVLCFFGMLIGVSLGSFATASRWIFAGAAGMFLYIALVDMLPELTVIDGHLNGNACRQFIAQFSGMATGTIIMLLIAIYEHDLKHLVS